MSNKTVIATNYQYPISFNMFIQGTNNECGLMIFWHTLLRLYAKQQSIRLVALGWGRLKVRLPARQPLCSDRGKDIHTYVPPQNCTNACYDNNALQHEEQWILSFTQKNSQHITDFSNSQSKAECTGVHAIGCQLELKLLCLTASFKRWRLLKILFHL